jgi:hypothetical protein
MTSIGVLLDEGINAYCKRDQKLDDADVYLCSIKITPSISAGGPSFEGPMAVTL